MLFTMILLFVIGALAYLLFVTSPNKKKETEGATKNKKKSLQEQAKHWKIILENLNDPSVVDETAYSSIYHQLRNHTQHELSAVLYMQDNLSFSAERLKKGPSDLRGSVIPFQGTVLKTNRVPLPIGTDEKTVEIYETWIEHPDEELIFRVHLLKTPSEKLRRAGAKVEGEGVYLTTVENEVPGQKEVQNVPMIMSHTLRNLDSDRKTTAEASTNQPGEDGPKQAEERSLKSGGTNGEESRQKDQQTFNWRKIPAPEDYTNRKQVISYWGKLLSSLDRDNSLPMDHPLYHRMIRELKRVEPDRFEGWVNRDIKPSWLTDENEKRLHRGKIVSFKGQYMYGRQLNVPGADDLKVWEFWLRDQENGVTYTVHALHDVNFRIERGTYIRGKGLFLQSPIYELKKPGPEGKTRAARTIFLLSHRLSPGYPNRQGGMHAVDWLELLLGGLFLLFLCIFIVVVFITTRKDVEKKTRYLQRLRKGRNKDERSDKMETEDDVDQSDDSSTTPEQ